MKNKLIVSTSTAFCGLIAANVCWAGVTLPSNVRDVADMLQYSAQEQQKKAFATAETKAGVEKIEQEIAALENTDVEVEVYNNTLRQQLHSLRKQLANANFEHNRKENRLQEIQQRKTDIESKNYELNKIVEVYGEGRKGYFAYQDIIYNDGIYEGLVHKEELLSSELNDLDTTIVALNQTIDALILKMNNENIAEDPALEEADKEARLEVLKHDLEYVQNLLKEYERGYDIADRKSSSFGTESKYYSWRDDKGNKGHQFYQPFYYNIVAGPWEYGLATGFISSDNRSNDNGKVNCLTDTTLNVAFHKKAKKNDVMVFSLAVNLPTGKDALHEFDPVMDEDLVEKARFGEGLNFTPAIWYYYNRDDKNTFIFGTYYTLGGRYDLTPSMWVEPGNAWVKEMRWQHLNKKFQFLAGLSHTSYERTRENTLEYTSGHQFKPELTFNYAPDNTQFFTAYYWHTQEDPLRYATFDRMNETRRGRNYGLQWSKDIPDNRRIRLLVDWLNSSGENYDPLTNISTNQRRKTTFGIGFDQYFKERPEKLSLDIETFRMKDGAVTGTSSDNNYRGFNVYLSYLKYM